MCIRDRYANHLTFQHSHWQRREWLKANPLAVAGTAIFMSLALNSTRTVEDVFAAHGKGSQDVSFARTEVALRLAAGADQTLESRALGKRIANRLESFEVVDLNFDGIEAVGQGFADELFRVFANQHPQVQLRPCNMNARVAAMVAQAQGK